MRHVPTRADDGGRVVITRTCRRPLLNRVHVIIGCQMLLDGGVDGHLNSIQRSRCGVCLLGPREYELAHLEVLMVPKMT